MGELVAGAAFCVAAAVLQLRLMGTEKPALWIALFPLILILWQAGAYWLLARSWVGKGSMPSGVAAVYRVFRVLNVLMLVASLVLVGLYLPSRVPVQVLVLAVWVFAVVEYVNYFVVRLAYPMSQWFNRVGEWRTPRLVADLQSARRGPTTGDQLADTGSPRSGR